MEAFVNGTSLVYFICHVNFERNELSGRDEHGRYESGRGDPSCMLLALSTVPILSDFLQSGAYIKHAFGWRWVYGIWGIVGAVLLIPFVILVPETRRSSILVARAQRARKAGHTEAWAIDESLRRRSFRQILSETLFRPAVMLFTEPIFTDMSLTSDVQYLAVEAIPLIYAQYGLVDPQIELTNLAILVGFTLAIPLFYFQRKATIWQEKKHGKKNVPENKLLWAFLAVFVAICDYTVESYGPIASSAITGQSFARECFCGLLALISVQFYLNVGFEYGPTIRKRSRYAQKIARLEEEERQRAKAIKLLDETKTQG
ncbi:hypothetical protein C0992_004718 [Termitomyces sp. T32_za158]|nr:hypothetical protein C0992_004718 [Termitomyces sp. T32_za158]